MRHVVRVNLDSCDYTIAADQYGHWQLYIGQDCRPSFIAAANCRLAEALPLRMQARTPCHWSARRLAETWAATNLLPDLCTVLPLPFCSILPDDPVFPAGRNVPTRFLQEQPQPPGPFRPAPGTQLALCFE